MEGAAAFANLPVGAPSQGMSPSASSQSSPYVAKPCQTVYTIPVVEQVDSSIGVVVMCESALSITPLFDDITEEGDYPPVWTELLQFVKAHSGSRIWCLRGEPRDLVDMVIMDVHEGLLVPGIHAHFTVPIWNEHPTRVNDRGRKESPFIHSCFELVGELLRDSAPLIVFYPDSKFISNELIGWADWAGFEEETKWFVINDLPLSRIGQRGRTQKCFKAKCFVRNLDGRVPFSFYERMELICDGIQLSTDGHLMNLITEDTLTLREGTTVPWRGAREKSNNLMEALIDMCTREDNIVLDLTASTSKY